MCVCYISIWLEYQKPSCECDAKMFQQNLKQLPETESYLSSNTLHNRTGCVDECGLTVSSTKGIQKLTSTIVHEWASGFLAALLVHIHE